MKLFASLRSRALLVILLATLPMLAFVIDGYRRERAAAIAGIDESTRAYLRASLRQETEVVKSIELTLRIMSNANDMKQPTTASCSGLAERLMKSQPDFSNIGAAWPDGDVFCSAWAITHAVNVTDRGWFQETLKTNRFTTGYYQKGRLSGERAVTYGMPQLDAAGNLRTALFAAVRLDWFVRLFDSIQLPPNWHALIVTRDGFVAARYPADSSAIQAMETDIPVILGHYPEAPEVRIWRKGPVEHLHGVAPLASTGSDLYLIIGTNTQSAMAPIDSRFRYQLVLTLMFALASAMLAWFALRGSVLAWAKQMNNAVKRFGDGHLDSRVGKISHVVELQALTDNFDAMAKRIGHINEELDARVKERTTDLERSNAELEAFAYSVSHDLRAPLRAIAGFGDILDENHKAQLDAEGQRYLANIRAAAAQMNRLIDDLLQYSRVGRGMALAERVELASLVDTVVALFEPRLPPGGRIEVDERLANPIGDPRLIGQILTNLIDNAIKYQPAGQAPVIRIDSRANGREVTLRVADNGIGIPTHCHTMIFNVFQRLHGDEDYPGTGIGLAIARKAARLMNGSLSVESIPEKGSTFTLTLPADLSVDSG